MNIKIFKNASWIIGCRIAQSMINLIIGMVSARYLGPSNYGIISYVSSIVAFVIPIMQLGLTKTIISDLILHPFEEGTIMGTALFMNIISAVSCIICVCCYFLVVDSYEPTTIIVGILYSISLLFQALNIFEYWFQAKLISKYASIAALIAYVGVATYKIILLISGKSVTWFALSNSLDYCVIAIFLICFYKKMGGQKLNISIKVGKEMLKKSKAFILSAMMVAVYQQTDRIMLKLMYNEIETGYYSAAVACVGMSGFVFVAIIDSFRPEILEAKKKCNLKYEKYIKELYSIITCLALAQSLIITIMAKPIIIILFGEEYLGSVAPLRIVVWFVSFAYYGTIRNVWLLAENKQKYLWIINCVGALLNIMLNIQMIPLFGSVGAAIASLLTLIFSNFILGFIIKPIRYSNILLLQGINPFYFLEAIKKMKKSIKFKK